MKKRILLTVWLMSFATLIFGFEEEDLEKFLVTNQCVNCDLALADLAGRNLSKARLRGADLFGVKLNEADLSEAELVGVNLIEADLSQTNLRKLVERASLGGYPDRGRPARGKVEWSGLGFCRPGTGQIL